MSGWMNGQKENEEGQMDGWKGRRMEGRKDRWTDRWADGGREGQMDGRTDGQIEGQMEEGKGR